MDTKVGVRLTIKLYIAAPHSQSAGNDAIQVAKEDQLNINLFAQKNQQLNEINERISELEVNNYTVWYAMFRSLVQYCFDHKWSRVTQKEHKTWIYYVDELLSNY